MAPFTEEEVDGASRLAREVNRRFDGALSPQKGLPEVSKDNNMPIAVVGMSFRGPADATSVEGLWRMIAEGREGWSKVPKERWNNDGFYHPDNARHGTINVEGAHFFSEDLARFDAPFFNMTSNEAAALDPQQRLLLEGAFEAFENAGLPLQYVAGSKTSCFVGSFSGDYTDMLLRDPESVPMYQCTNAGHSRAITANRISYFFDLKGPSVTVDTACSGSLTALHLACQSLRTGDAQMAVAAGVNTILSHEFMNTMSMMKFLSPDGRCYTFDERGNGYGRGEGVGILILKPIVNALRDHDTIQAVIRGSGSNQDGRTSGITLPSGEAQEALIRDVYESAGLDPLETEFVEAHGTGTQAGDPTETGALARVFGPGRPADLPLRIGSIKTNVGHMEGASGIGGVIKAVLMLQNRILLPNRNFKSLNSRILLDEWKQKIQLSVEPWKTPGSHRVSVNSFGYGGSNAHVVLEDALGYFSLHGLCGEATQPFIDGHNREYLPNSTAGDVQENGIPIGFRKPKYRNGNLDSKKKSGNGSRPRQRAWLFTLSSFDQTSSESQIHRLRDYLKTKRVVEDEEFLDKLAYTLNERRTNFTWKAAFSGGSVEELVQTLNNVKPKRSNKRPTICFVFTGQGAQWCGMGKELLDTYPVFGEVIDKITAYLAFLNAPFSVREELTRDPTDSQINTALYSQPMCSAIQIALIELFSSWGIKPASVTGHSSGEIAAAYAIGALSLEDAMSAAYFRGLRAYEMQRSGQATSGAMMAVDMTKNDADAYLPMLTRGKAVVACVNSPSSVTISGDRSAIDELKVQLDKEGIFARKLAVEVAYHSHHMGLISEAYRSSISKLQAKATDGDVEFFSSVTGSRANSSNLGPDYWVSNMIGQVKFADSLRSLCLQTSNGKARSRKVRPRAGAATKVSVDLLIEIGPHSALQGPIQQILQADQKLTASPIAYASALVRKKCAVMTTLALSKKLFTMGYPVNFAAINRPRALKPTETVQCLTDLPPYPWNHARTYWAEPRVSKVYRTRKYPRTDLLGVPDRHASEREPRWRNHIRVQEIPWVRDHRIQSNIIYPAAGYLAMALEAIHQSVAEHSHLTVTEYSLRDVSIESAMVLDEQASTEVLVSLWPDEIGATSTFSGWQEFRIESVSDPNTWKQHCSGLVAVKYAVEHAEDSPSVREQILEAGKLKKTFAEADHKCTAIVDVPAFYSHLAHLGIEYGATFANMTNARSSTGTCLAQVKIADIAETMPMDFQYPFIIHPSTLDSILHPIFVALSADSTRLENPAIPVSFEELHLSRDLDVTPGHTLDVLAIASYHGQTNIVANVDVVNDMASPQTNLSLRGLALRVLEAENGTKTEEEEPPIAYKFKWAPDVDLLPAEVTARLCGTTVVDESVPCTSYEQRVARYIQKAAQVLGQGHFDAMPRRLRDQLSRLKASARDFDEQQSEPIDNSDDPMFLKTQDSGPADTLLTTTGERLPTLLSKQADMSAVSSRSNLLDKFWSEDTTVVGSYHAAARCLNLLGHKNPHQSILEINAGSGAAASVILETLTKEDRKAPALERYTVTDPDPFQLETCSQRLSAWQDIATLKPFNVFADAREQQIEPESFDVVILARGLALVPDKHRTLAIAYTLLRPGGRLMVIDAMDGREGMLRDFVCGTLAAFGTGDADGDVSIGRWSRNQWHEALQGANFSGLSTCIPCNLGRPEDGAFLLIAQAKPPKTLSTDGILIITEEEERGVDISLLRQLLAKEHTQVDIASWAEVRPAGRLCIVLSELTTSILSQPDPGNWETIKQIFLKSAGVLWVVRGGTGFCPDPTASLSFGFARTARSELGESSIITLDLDLESPMDSEEAARTIFRLVTYELLSDRSGNALEPEYAERNGDLLIPRVIEDATLNKAISLYRGVTIPELQPLQQFDRLLHATVEKSRQWETIRFVDGLLPTPLPEDYIGIEVRASGLTYVDLKMSESSLGSECSGVVRAVGAAVKDFSIGDRVACIASGSVANFYYNRSSTFQRIPDELSFTLAAALPVAYCVAYYAVYRLARLSGAEKVLIHGAMEPCGQAIIDLCGQLSVEIFATVKSQAEVNILEALFGIPRSHIFYGNDDSVTKAIYRVTNSRGADVVINVDGADREQLRLSWRYIAPYGRFINLANGEIPCGSRLDIVRFNKDASFASFDLVNLVRERPDIADRTWAEVMCLLRAKAINGPQEPTTYSFSDLSKALQHIDTTPGPTKVVVTAEPGALVKATPQVEISPLFHPKSSYMLVGGLGGIGRATAMWMIEHGARHLVLVNRSGTSKPEAQETLRALELKGATVKVCACDISDEAQVIGMLTTLSRVATPIKGVIQAAMLIRDNYIEKTSAEDYLAVIQPKFNGTWNLHKHLPQNLDFFVMLSSISGVIGNATQGAYAAGSSFMDSFAAYRNSLGLPAVALDLGVVGGIGYLSKNKGLAAAMERQGFHVTDPEILLALIQSAITVPRRQEGLQPAQTVSGLGTWKQGQSLANFDAPLFAHVRRRFLSLNSSTPAPGDSDTTDNLSDALGACASLDDAGVVILAALTRHLAARLSVPEEDIDADKAPSEYGVNSLVAVEMRRWIATEMQSTVPMLEIMASGSLAGLARKVGEKSKLVKVKREGEGEGLG